MKKAQFLSMTLSLCLVAGCLGACNPGSKDPDNGSGAFTWTGLENVTIAAGDQYDVMEGITVENGSGQDITDKATVLTLEDNEEELTDLGVYDDFEDFNYNITGVYTVYYMVTDGGKTETESREIAVTQQHNIANGDFAVTNNTGFYNWTFDAPGGTATLEKVTENGVQKPKFNISAAGNSWFALQYMSSVNLIEGETYQITVRAKSTNGKSFAFGFENVANNYSMMQGLTAFTAGTEYADYVSYYTADQDYTNAKAVLYFGYILEGAGVSQAYDLTIDSIKIEKVERCPNVTFEGLDSVTLYTVTSELAEFDPMEGVTATDGETDLTNSIQVIGSVAGTVMEMNRFTLAYIIENENGPMAIGYRTVVVRLGKVNDYDLMNGTFDENINYWVQDVNAQNPGQAEFSWVAGDNNEGAAQIHIVNPSTEGWHIQFRQDVTLAANTNYIITIRAKSSVARSISLELNSTTNSAYTVSLTTEYTETTIYYNYSAATTGFRFLVGGGGSAMNDSYIWIDSAVITLDPDQTQYEAWQMQNPNFAQGMRNWGSEGAAFEAGEDANGTYVQATIDTTLADGAAWRTQLRQDGKSFQEGVTYKLIIKASASVARTIGYEVNPNNGGWTSTGNINLTTEVQTFEFEFTATSDTSGSRVALLLNGDGAGGTTVNIYQFEIVIVSGAEAE